MSRLKSGVRLRKVTIEDVEDLHKTIVKSSEGQETLSVTSLRDDLFPERQVIRPDVTSSDAYIELDLEQFELQCPIVQAIVAEMDGHSIGHAIFHYYYTPWVGHGYFIDDVFVKNCIDDNGEIIHLLLEKVIEMAREENLKMLVINESKLSPALLSSSEKEFVYIRGPQTDWSVLRIHFDDEK